VVEKMQEEGVTASESGEELFWLSLPT